jgi:Cu-processing system permease protein
MSALAMTSTASVSRRARSPVACVALLARREFRDAISSRWFLLYALAFAALAVAVSFLSLAGTGSFGFAGFGKTAAGLLNLIMLVVPLMALTAGAGSIAGERERGTLLYLVAQPVSRSEILLGKFLGLALALCCALLFGFGLSALALAIRTGAVGFGAFVTLVGMACALACAMLSVGMLVSVLSRRVGIATGVSMFVWLVLVFVSDLGLMAGALLFKLRAHEVFAIAIANPLQAFKMSVVTAMNGSLDVLGPVGVYSTQNFGAALPWILAGVLAAWTVLPLALATVIFSRNTTS